MKRVLVTGATGFVGGHVARALRDHGHQVTGLVRDRGRARDLAGVRLIGGDMLQPDTYRGLVADVDAVIHAAQYRPGPRLGARGVRAIEHADAVMTTTLALACQQHGARFVYTSGCFVYGDHGEEWIDHHTPMTPSPLGRGHTSRVHALRDQHRNGLDLVVIAPGFVYGPGGLFQTAFYDQLASGRLRVIGAGRNWWSCIHVTDLAAAYVAAVESAASGTEVDVVDNEPVRLRDMVDLLTDAMAHRRVGTVPPWLIGLLIGEPLAASLATSFRIRADTAHTALNWQPSHPTFHEGLPSTLAALKAR